MTDSYGSIARIYDGEYRHFNSDVALVLERLAAERVRGPVLDLACGTGRLTFPLLAAGYRVTGVDLSDAMLRRARQRRRALPPDDRIRLRFARQDMTQLKLRGGQFRATVIGFSSFNLLATEEQRLDCLDGIARHLEPGGVALLDLIGPALEPANQPQQLERTFRLPPHGHLVRKVIEQNPTDSPEVRSVRYCYEVHRWHDDQLVDHLQVEFPMAIVSRSELHAALYTAGFDVELELGDHAGRPYTPGSPRLFVQARRL